MRSILFILLTIISANFASATINITDPGQGVFDFMGSASDLSGLTYVSGSQYYAVSDSSPKIFPLTIGLNLNNGFVTSASLGTPISLDAGVDNEGIAYHAGRNTYFVSDEGQHPTGGFIREFNISGITVGSVGVPPVMQNDRPNLGLESMSYGNGTLWTANEEALEQESTTSTASSGSLVRLQEFNPSMTANGQWAYRTDPHGGANFLTGLERSGISDLVALPDGNLLVLERALGDGTLLPSFRSSIYLVDFTGATDVSAIDDLDVGLFIEVNKTLLWEQNMGSVETRNFEGIALGPQLINGDYSLLLIADNGGRTDQQHLYALTVSGVVIPEPQTSFLVIVGIGLISLYMRKRSKTSVQA